MISYHKGNVLKSGCDVICHQVNIQGIMGGGLALQIARKYPNIKKKYSEHCQLFGMSNLFGDCLVLKSDENQYVANCFSQDEHFNTNYNAVEECFNKVKQFCEEQRLKTVAVPFNYGCGIANGQWEKVLEVFKNIFEKSEIELQVWKI